MFQPVVDWTASIGHKPLNGYRFEERVSGLLNFLHTQFQYTTGTVTTTKKIQEAYPLLWRLSGPKDSADSSFTDDFVEYIALKDLQRSTEQTEDRT